MEQQSPCFPCASASWLCACLAVFIADGSLERSNCFVLFLGHLEQRKGEATSGHCGHAKEELVLGASLRSNPFLHAKVETGTCLIYLLNKSL